MRTADRRRESILDAAVTEFSAAADVVAVFLSGSLAAGNEDEHSDIDLRVVVSSDGYACFLARRAEAPRSWGPFLFHETVGSNYTVTYYEGLTKLDLFYYDIASFEASPWLGLPTKVLFERGDQISAMISSSSELTWRTDSDAVSSTSASLVAHLIEACKRMLRGDVMYARMLTEGAVDRLVMLDDLLNGRLPVGPSRFRERGTPLVAESIARVFMVGDLAEQLESLIDIALATVDQARRRQLLEPSVCDALEQALQETLVLLN